MNNIFNAHVALHLRVSPSEHRAINMHVYQDKDTGRTVHELLNFRAYQNMPALLSVSDFTDDHQSQANQVVTEGIESVRYGKAYTTHWRAGLSRCTVQLLTDINTRRANILFSDEYPQPSCLMSVQFLVRNQRLDMIANFRSWELQEFAKYDICLLLTMAKEMSRHLNDISLGTLYINAGSAHIMIIG